jgi:hypothetical protein
MSCVSVASRPETTCDRQLEMGETALPVDVAKKAGFLV